MKFLLSYVLSLVSLVNLALSAPLEARSPSCTDFVIPVTISANNVDLPQSLLTHFVDQPLDLLGILLGTVFDLLVSGTYNIQARYCEPEVFVPSRSNTLQFLTHGATYDRNFWSGDSPPGVNPANDRYSWQAYASQQGYPTFSYDRLGTGASSHPDPLLVVQIPAHAEIAHQLLQMLRNRSPAISAHVPRAFSKIISVGHSIGSIVANDHSVKYPNDINAIILTGFSESILVPASGVLLTAGVFPADTVDPVKFGSLSIGYLEPTSPFGMQFLFWYPGNYDPAFQAIDYTLRGTITVGEGATAALGIQTAPLFTGPVFVVTGDKDVLFCGVTGTILTGPGDCTGTGLLQSTSSLYPRASQYDWFAVPDCGHDWQFHLNSQIGFQQSFAWLAANGF